jgi:hypothetical protein
VERYKLFEVSPTGPMKGSSCGVRLFRAERIAAPLVSIERELTQELEATLKSSSEEVRTLLEKAVRRVG